MSAVASSAFRTRSNRRHAAFSESRLNRRCCPLFRNPGWTKFPAGRSSSLLFILFFYPNLSVCGCRIRFSEPAQIVGIPFFRNPVRIVGVVRFFGIPFGQSFPQGGALLYYLYCSFIRIYLSAVVASAFRNPLKSSAYRFFGILFGSSVLSAFSESRSDKVSR